MEKSSQEPSKEEARDVSLIEQRINQSQCDDTWSSSSSDATQSFSDSSSERLAERAMVNHYGNMISVGNEKINEKVNDPAMYLKDELYRRMREEPHMFDWIQTALGDGVWYWDLEQPHIEWMSPEFKELFGYTDEEVPNTPDWWMSAIFEEDKIEALKAFDNHVQHGAPYDMIVRYKHKDGSTVWVRCHGKAFFGSSDTTKPIRMLGCHNDVTQLMKVQEALRKKEAILDLLTTTSLDGYWDWNLLTGETLMSERWKNILGYQENELAITIETWLSLVVPDDLNKWNEAVRAHKERNEPLNVVIRYKRKIGTVAHMLTQGVAQRSGNDPNGEWVRMYGTHADVSYLEEARMAKEASAAKTTFLATMSHEIRTPLNAVLGMAQALMTTELNDEQLDCVKILHNSGAHLLSLINDILDFSQIETGMISLANEEVDIQKNVRNVLVVLQQSRIATANMNNTNEGIDNKSISDLASVTKSPVVCGYEGGAKTRFITKVPVNTKIFGDPERIRQVLFNLVGNALKFTAEGTVTVLMELESKTKRQIYKEQHSTFNKESSVSSKQLANHAVAFQQLQTYQKENVVLNSMTSIASHHLYQRHDSTGVSINSSNTDSRSSIGHHESDVICDESVDNKQNIHGIAISVEDTGCGIAPDSLLFIFDDFRQASYDIRCKYGGNGLGLSICKKLVLAMGGTLTVSSVLGQGSTFRFWLPGLVDSPPTTIITLQESNTSTIEVIDAPSVYLLEDLENNSTSCSLEYCLQASGFKPQRIRYGNNDHNDSITPLQTTAATDTTCATITTQMLLDSKEVSKVVVVNQQGNDNKLLQETVVKLLKGDETRPSDSNELTRRIRIVDIGRKVNRIIPEECKLQYYSTVQFPTSDEVYEVITASPDDRAEKFTTSSNVAIQSISIPFGPSLTNNYNYTKTNDGDGFCLGTV